MPSLFSRLKTKDGSQKKSKKGSNFDAADQLSAKPKWDDAYTRKTVEPEEIQDLIRRCTGELKARGGFDIYPLPLPTPHIASVQSVALMTTNIFLRYSS